MPYRGIHFIENSLVHIFNRGNNHMTLFETPEDYDWLINKTNALAIEKYFEIPAFCLMPNHYHFYLQLKTEGDLPKFFQRLQLAYAKYFNRRYGHSGHVFEGPFQSVLVDREEFAIHLSRYIHLNPVKAGLVQYPEQWKYSNYAMIIKQKPAAFRQGFYGSYFREPSDYADFVCAKLDEPDKNIMKWLFD